MKGLVFTEFLEMVEAVFDDDMVDTLIERTQPASKGAYTSVGSYDYQELEDMLVELSAQASVPVGELLQRFGEHLASVFTQKFAVFFVEAGDAISLFKEIDRHIHVEVKKLYPDAELPKFSFESATQTEPFKLHYSSERNLHLLAYGLITAICEYYQRPHDIQMLTSHKQGDYSCTFSLTPHAQII